ncbi:hypothetical protein K438DRAFT_1784183 [Mycena galopus ATCC 62051]|nr:hypothetical protein K438DRAFT_1784183 [Mycena galopus ATCC 62051]
MSSVALHCRFLLLALCWQFSCAALEASSGSDSPYGYARAITSERWRDWTKKKQDPLLLFNTTTDSTPSLSSGNSLTLHSVSPRSMHTLRHGTQVSTARSMAEYRAGVGANGYCLCLCGTHLWGDDTHTAVSVADTPRRGGEAAGSAGVVRGAMHGPQVEVLQLTVLGEGSLEAAGGATCGAGSADGVGVGDGKREWVRDWEWIREQEREG